MRSLFCCPQKISYAIWQNQLLRREATVHVFEPHNVIFAEIAADLYFDQLERNFAWIAKPVNAPNRNIDRFILMHDSRLATDCHLGGSPNDNPMLSAVKVLLHGKAGA